MVHFNGSDMTVTQVLDTICSNVDHGTLVARAQLSCPANKGKTRHWVFFTIQMASAILNLSAACWTLYHLNN